jgi:hypothetical protein
MDEFQHEGFESELMPFMTGLMSSLMSKEMMYPSLKEMVDKVGHTYCQLNYAPSYTIVSTMARHTQDDNK